MIKFSKATKISYWSLLACLLALVSIIILIFTFVLKKYYLIVALIAVIIMSCYVFNMIMSKYYLICDDGIAYYFHNKEKLRIAYGSIDHAELIMRRERNVEFEQLKIFFDNRKHSIRVSFYDNVEELLDALSEHGIRIELPAEYISAKHIDYMWREK